MVEDLNWDYNKICKEDGDVWNKIPDVEQLEILKKYYPIGMKVCFFESREVHGEIIDYAISEINRNQKNNYILRLKFDKIGQKYNFAGTSFSSITEEYKNMHPGFFIPTIEYFRNNKLGNIGI